ncbi:MAG: TetR/AcrR family transcriptional regulator, partial [Bacteroidota bacterium]
FTLSSVMPAISIKNSNKESKILQAAEELFFSVGFANAKMEDIAKKADFSKVTVYSYFGSKANLYMAITYNAMQDLINGLYAVLEQEKGKSGFDTFIALSVKYLDFCVRKRHYVDLMLNYLSMVRMAVAGEKLDKLSQSLQESIYYRKLRGIQNVSIELAVEEIVRGQKDGSIKTKKSPWIIHHMMWSMITGFAKVNYQPSAKTFIHADNEEWKTLLINTIRGICQDKI